MPDPIIEKAAGDNIPFVHDWSKDLARLGDALITESHWNVDVGSIVIGSDGRSSFIAGPITGCYVQGGTPDEYCVLNNSILLNKAVDPDSGNKLVRRFIVHILDGLWEPMTPPVVILPDGLADIATLEAFRGATPGVSIWVDATPDYPAGDLYYAVPDSYAVTPDGHLVVQGRLVKWISIHGLGSYTGVLPSRSISTTAPLTGGGDLSTNRTLGISAATTSAAGSMSPTQVTELNALLGATLLTDANESATLPNSDQLSIRDGDPNSALVIDHEGSGSWTISALFGATATTYMRGNAISGTPNVVAKFVGNTAVGNSNISDDGSHVFVTHDAATALSPIDSGQLILRGATNNTYRLGLSIDTALNVGIIQAGRSGFTELPLSFNPKGLANVGIGTSSPRTQVSIVNASVDTIPSPGAAGGKFSILNETAGNYGMLFGVLAAGTGFIQQQRVDGTNSTYNLLLNPNGGNVGINHNSITPAAALDVNGNLFARYNSCFGGNTNPTAAVDTTTLRVRTGAAAGFLAQSDANGNVTWSDRTLIVNSEGTHQQHSKHFEAVVPYNTTRSFGFTESQWKGNSLAPTGDTGVRGCSDASISVRIIGRDSNATGNAFDWTYRGTIQRVYDTGAGGSWVTTIGLTAVTGLCIGSNSTVSAAFGLSGAANGTITVTIYNVISSGIPADCALIVDIIGAGNYTA